MTPFGLIVAIPLLIWYSYDPEPPMTLSSKVSSIGNTILCDGKITVSGSTTWTRFSATNDL